jgi:hypothetical protein
VTCSIEGIVAAAPIAIRCRTPSIPTDPIAMNMVRIPANASVRSPRLGIIGPRICAGIIRRTADDPRDRRVHRV